MARWVFVGVLITITVAGLILLRYQRPTASKRVITGLH